jgi:enamine deaminase RidA (YjgF/YER057c/UK114 family)
MSQPSAERPDHDGPSVLERLAELGVELSDVPPLGYAPNRSILTVHAGLAYVSGVGPIGQEGIVGGDLTVEEGYAAARTAACYCLRRIQDELGSLERIDRWIKVLGFVRSAPGFDQQPRVLNGFSDLIVSVWGERGRSARSAIGTSELPHHMPIEVEAIISIRD